MNSQTFAASPRWLPGLALGLLAAVGIGCTPDSGFKLNRVYLRINETIAATATKEDPHPFDRHQDDLRTVTYALFGSPDEPMVPPLPDVDTAALLDVNKLKTAAGPVRSDEHGNAQGLFREHCAHCHGVTGDGAGPTAAFLNPYPRDFRKGVFKFKSTPKGERPTHDDLKRIVVNGIPGTAMPSFRLLSDPDLEALLAYVKYLSIRGEVERKLIEQLPDFDDGDRLIVEGDQFAEKLNDIKEIAAVVVKRWENAPQTAVAIEQRPPGWDDPETLEASIERGRRLFYGEVANCVKCHGESALGDGVTNDYDDWAKDFIPPNATPEKIRELSQAYTALGAMEPRHIQPRNLRRGVFRGGRRPIDVYWRMRNGIEGTPMPAVLMKDPMAPADTKGLTEDDLWSLIDYVRNLEHEPLSRPPNRSLAENLRERP